jgi:Fe-S-cluster containining protein
MSASCEAGAVDIEFAIRVADQKLAARVRVPTAEIRSADLLPVLQSLFDAVQDIYVREVEGRGKTIPCRAGCDACCCQLVPISETEAVYLAELVGSMPESRRAKVRARFDAGLKQLEVCGLRERLRDPGSAESRRELGLEYFDQRIACPFLEERSCGIHQHRPMSCREYLVISPASWCADPRAGRVETVQIPRRPSDLLYRFGDGRGEDEVRVVPLIGALEWAEQNAAKQRRFPGPQLFESFVRRLSG